MSWETIKKNMQENNGRYKVKESTGGKVDPNETENVKKFWNDTKNIFLNTVVDVAKDQVKNSIGNKKNDESIWSRVQSITNNNWNELNNKTSVVDNSKRIQMTKRVEDYTNTKRNAMQSVSDIIQENAKRREELEQQRQTQQNEIREAFKTQNKATVTTDQEEKSKKAIIEDNKLNKYKATIANEEDVKDAKIMNTEDMYKITGGLIDRRNNAQKIVDDMNGIVGNTLVGLESVIPSSVNYINGVYEYGHSKLGEEIAKIVSGDSEENRELGRNVGKEINKLSVWSRANEDLNSEERKNKRKEIIQSNIDKTSNPLTKKLAEIMPSVGQNAIPMAVTTVNPVAGTALFITSAGGNYLDEAKEMGMSDDQSIAYATVMAGVEGGSEAIISADFINGAIKKVGLKGLSDEILKKAGVNIGENFLQEFSTEYINEYTKSLVSIGDDTSVLEGVLGKGKYADWEDIHARALESGIDGIISAVILDGASLGVSSAVNVVNGKSTDIAKAYKDSEKVVDMKKIKEGAGKAVQNQIQKEIEGTNFQQNDLENNLQSMYNSTDLDKVQNVPIESLLQFKTDGGYRNEQYMTQLREDIRKNGIDNPIELVRNNDGSIAIENGNHRLQIAKELGLKEVPIKFVESWDNIGQVDKSETKLIERLEGYNDRNNTNSRKIDSFNGGNRVNQEYSTNYRNKFENREAATRNDRLFNEIQALDDGSSSNSTFKQNSKEVNNRGTNFQQDTLENPITPLSQQITSQENKVTQNGNMERLDNMQTIKGYHGTDANFENYNLEHFGKHDEGDFGKAVYFSTNKLTATKYGKNVKENNINLENPFIINNEQDYKKMWNELGKRADKEKLSIEEKNLIEDKYTSQTDKDYMLYNTLTAEEKSNILQEMGYDGVIDNTYNQIAVFNPNNIANNQQTVYNNTESVGRINERNQFTNQQETIREIKNRENEQSRIWRDNETMRGQEQGRSTKNIESNTTGQATNQGVLGLYENNTEQQTIGEAYNDKVAIRETIDYANKNKQLNPSKGIIEIQKKAKELGINVIAYNGKDGNKHIGLLDGNNVYLDMNKNNISIEDGSAMDRFSHEVLHYIKRNTSFNSTINELQTKIIDQYPEIINNFVNNKGYDVNSIPEGVKLALAEEVLGDYSAKYIAGYNIDYGLPEEIIYTLNTTIDDGITELKLKNQNNNIAPIGENVETNKKRQIYRDTANANKLIKEKNNKIRQIENEMIQATTQEQRNSLLKEIDSVQNEYSNKMHDLFSEINKLSDKDNSTPYRTIEEIANDSNISDIQAFQEATKQLDTPSDRILQQKENELSSEGFEKSPTIDYIKKKRSKEKPTLKQVKDVLAQKFVNKGHYIDKLAKQTNNNKLTWLYDRTMNTFSEAQICIGDYQINSKGEKVGKSIIDIFEPAQRANVSLEFDDYLLNKHNISRYAHEKGLYGEDISSLGSQKIVEHYENKYPEFKEWAKEVNVYNDNNLRDLVDNGMVSKDMYKKLKDMYGDYVPTYRDITDNISQYVDDSIGGNTIKKATQSDKNILSVSESMVEQTLAIKKAIRMNNLGVELYNTLGKGGETLTGIDFSDVAIQTLGGDVIEHATDGTNTFAIFQDGEMTRFKISDELYTAFAKDTLQNKINNSKVAKAILTPVEKLSKAQRELLTTYSIGFSFNNPIKDFQDALFNSKYGGATFAKNWIKALYNIGIKGNWYESYKNNGGVANTYFDYDKGILPTKTKNPFKKFGNAIRTVNEVLEQAPRLAEYISTIEHKGSIDEALYNAAEITTNFKRGGNVTKAVNKYGANFLNASVQGLDKFYRNISGQKGWKGYANILTKATVYMIAPAIINGLLLGDDEDYEDLPEYIKDEYYLFKTGEGKFFRIPKGRVSSVIGGLARRCLETGQGKDVDWESLIDTTINQLAPNNPLKDNLIAPISQAVKNEAWYGGEIVSSRLQKLPVAEQYDESTDELSKWIGKKLNISPKKINYVLDQYSGGIGDVLLPTMTPQAENNILEDKFTTDSVMKNKHVSEYYSKLEELEKNKNSKNVTDEDRLKYKYMSEISEDLSDLYNQKRKIQNSNSSDKEKKEAVRNVQRKINSIIEERLEKVEDIKTTTLTAKVGGVEYYKYNNEWTRLSDEEKEKNKNISLISYADYKNKVYNLTKKKKDSGEIKKKGQLKNKDKIEVLFNSKATEKEKEEIYKNYIGTEDKKIQLVDKLNFPLKEYLKYRQQDFENDKDKNGESISGTKEQKVYDYLNNISSVDLSDDYKKIICKIEGINDYDKDVVAFINNYKSITPSERKELLKILGYKIDEDGNIITTSILPLRKYIK